MSLDDRTANRKSHSDALRSGREERLKQAGHVLRTDTDPAVLNENADSIFFLSPGPDHQPTRPSSDSRHGFNSIQHQIEDDLLQLNSIAKHDGQVGDKFDLNEYIVPRSLTLGKSDRFFDDFIQLDLRPLRSRLVDQRSNSADNFRGASRTQNRSLCCRTRFDQIRTLKA